MAHINSILEGVERAFLTTVTGRTRYRFVFDPMTLVPDIENSGERYGISIYPSIKYLLDGAAGPEHGIQSVRDVLTAILLQEASEHSRRPAKAVKAFLADLERCSVASFISDCGEQDRRGRDARLRRRLAKLGYRLIKSRVRDPLSDHYQMYDLVDRAGYIILGAPRDLERLERWIEAQRTDVDQPANKPRGGTETAHE